MDSLDEIFDDLPTWKRNAVNQVVEGDSSKAGAGFGGLAAIIAADVAVAAGFAGLAVPAIALATGYLVYKGGKKFSRYAIRKMVNKATADSDSDSFNR